MRKFLGPLTLLFAVLGASPASFAQSAYDYPWCSIRSGWAGGGQSCYFRSHAQCVASLSGVGGTCIRNPGYRGPGPRRYRGY